MRSYTVTLAFEDYHSHRQVALVLRGDYFVAERVIRAPNRQTAVRLALQWFAKYFKHHAGPPEKVLTVDDPAGEAAYRPGFNGDDLRNLFLPPDVRARLLAEARGELVQDAASGRLRYRDGAVCQPPPEARGQVRVIAPCVCQNERGTLFYRITEQTQASRSGQLLRKRKTRLIRLTARTLAEAAKEIEDRRLHELHQARRASRQRSLAVLQKLAAALGPGPATAAAPGAGDSPPLPFPAVPPRRGPDSQPPPPNNSPSPAAAASPPDKPGVLIPLIRPLDPDQTPSAPEPTAARR
ncbi:MAG TPA: hypothetical protein PK406_14220 [Verrucomicrobiota bacterium]|nr:hypothetical protein [Verrucomicrobiota bacterium]